MKERREGKERKKKDRERKKRKKEKGKEKEKRKERKRKRERSFIVKREYFKIEHPQRRVPSEARDVAATEKKILRWK